MANQTIQQIKPSIFLKERDIQKLFEANLDALFVAAPQPTKGIPGLTPKELEASEPGQPEPEQPIYTLDSHLARKSKELQDLYYSHHEGIFSLAEEGEITEKPSKMYIGDKHGKNFCEVQIQSKAIVVWQDIPFRDPSVPSRSVRDVTKIGHYGTGNVEMRITQQTDIKIVMDLIQQSFNQTI